MFAPGTYEIRNLENNRDPRYGVLTVSPLQEDGIWNLTFVPVDDQDAWPLDLSEGTFEFKAVKKSDFPVGGEERTSRMSLATFPAVQNRGNGPHACQVNPGPCSVTDAQDALNMIGIFNGNSSSYVYSDQGLIQRGGMSWPFQLALEEVAILALSEATTPGEVQKIADDEFGEDQVKRSLYERTP